jgi:putative peptidoglycan lipid II flippase
MNQLLKSSIVVGVSTFVCRIFGLLRELYIASLFGTSQDADSINTALKLPNLFRRLFGEGAVSSVLVPKYKRIMHSSLTHSFPNKYLSNVTSSIFYIMLIIFILLEIFMEQVITLMAPGFLSDINHFNTAVLLSRITAPYMIMICLSAIYGGILNARDIFLPFAIAPVIMSLSVLILSPVLIFCGVTDVVSVSFSLTISGILQLLYLTYVLYNNNIIINIFKFTIDNELKLFLKDLCPAIAIQGTYQINLFISNSIASFFKGAVSILSYADRLYQFPLSIVGITLSTVLLPAFSSKSQSETKALLYSSLSIGFALSACAFVGLFSIGKEIVEIIYVRGNFTNEDAMNTYKALVCYSIGIPAFTLNKIFTSYFYSKENANLALKITVKTIVVNVLLNIVFAYLFGFVGVAIGTSISSWYSIYLSIKIDDINAFDIFVQNKIIFIKTLFMVVYIIASSYLCNLIFNIESNFHKILYILFIGFSSGLLFLAIFVRKNKF